MESIELMTARHIDDIDAALEEGRPVYRVDDINWPRTQVDFIDEDELMNHPFRFEVD